MKPIVRQPIPKEARETLSEYPELLQHLLFYRGIADASIARAFLNPDYRAHIHDPFLMKGMDKAVERIFKAIQGNERVVIFSDYDADGIPGGVLLHDFFKKIGFTNFTNYIPHRHDEGFGLNHEAVDEFVKGNVKLMITVDCGIADSKEVAHACKHGIDTIVTDHHEPPSQGVPKAVAVLDPKQEGCAYPFKELCGAGVAFKLVQALLRYASTLDPTPLTLPPVGWEKWLLDLVGLATLSDMVPLLGENRVLARYGLVVLRKSPRPGLQRLFRKVGLNQRMLTEDDVVFSVTPKLNAASRMGSADAAFRLLATTDESEADAAVEELWKLNNERKGVVGSLVREIKKVLAGRSSNQPSVLVVGNPNWRPALLGLVANALAKEYACPVFLWGRDGDDCLKGSCRSDGQINLMKLMYEARDAFVEYGGHAFSGGFTIVPEKVHVLESVLSDAYQKIGASSSVPESIIADRAISPDEVTSSIHRLIQQLSPFGQGNPKPLFLLERVAVSNARHFGKEKNHLEVALSKSDGGLLKAVSFFSEAPLPNPGDKISLLVSLEQSFFGGRGELRLRIVDIIE